MTPEQGTFRKRMPRDRATAEEFGWRTLAGRLQIPALHKRLQVDEAQDALVYEDVFASGRAGHLLGDLIALADSDPTVLDAVTALVDAVCDDLIGAVATSGRTATLAECVPGLYTDRIRPGGRIDAWWLDTDLTLASAGSDRDMPVVRDLAGYTVTVNDTRLTLDVAAAIRAARTALSPSGRWSTALTQGDPTEPNIASSATGACWLDFEYAGRNTIAGEIANCLWYLLALGGWLVPLRQRDTYISTLRLHLPPTAAPAVRHAEISTRHRHLDLTYAWHTGPGRRAALTRFLTRLTGDLGAAAGLTAGRELEALRPFLTARILGVIPPRLLGGAELLLVLAKLAETQVAADHLARTSQPPCPTPHPWSCCDPRLH